MNSFFTHLKQILVTAIVSALTSAPHTPVLGGENHLNFGFHADGKTTTTFTATSNDEANAVAFYQGTSQIVVAGVTDGGGSSDNFCVMRYNSTGGLDTNFGTNGKVQTDFGGNERVSKIAVQSDGKIIVVGAVTNLTTFASDFAVARYNADGSLDTTFSADGKMTIDIQGDDFARGLAIDSAGKILIAGSVNGSSMWGLVRLNANGTLDTSFDGDGRVTTDFGGTSEYPSGVVDLPDGKIVLGGTVRPAASSHTDFALARYNSNGGLDTTFDGDGKVVTDFNSLMNDALGFKRDPAGKYVLVGRSVNAAGTQVFTTIARYTASGALDTTFNGIGWVHADLNPSGDEGGSDVAFNSFGRITVAGRVESGVPPTNHFVLLRVLSNGQRDVSFGTGGRVNTLFGTGIAVAHAIAISPALIDPDLDNIYAVGLYDPLGFPSSDDSDFAVARYRSGGPANRSQLYSAGDASLGVFRPSDGNWYFLNLATGDYNIFHWGQAGDIPVPGDYDGDGVTDTAVFRGGIWHILNSVSQTYTVVQFGFASDKPTQGDYDGDGECDIAVYRPSNGAWHLLRSSLGYTSVGFGLAEDKPAQDDFDGDGLTDFAVFRPSTGVWYMQRSILGYYAAQFGTAGDRPVPADYDGDGKSDIAVYRPSTGAWYTVNSQTGTNLIAQFGISTDIPGPADFDGDGKSDLTVFRPSTGAWYSLRSSDAGATIVGWGANGDVPISASYNPQ